jgi:signal transduction histidine kinase
MNHIHKTKAQLIRELEIETSLERVRSQIFGMQESSELAGVATSLFDELSALGLQIFIAMIHRWSKENDTHMMMTSGISTSFFEFTPEELVSRVVPTMKLSEASFVNEMIERFESGETYVSQEHRRSPDEARNYWQEKFQSRAEILGRDQEWIDRQTKGLVAIHPHDQPSHFFAFTNGALRVTTMTDLTEADKEMIKRFVGVFDFAYKRFLDLEANEKQTREARRRAAVDRVRAEATAMQQSADVVQVLAGLWQGLQDAGLTFVACGIQFVNEPANALTHYTIAETIGGMPEQKLFRKDVFDGVDVYVTNIPLAFARERGYATPGVAPSVHTMADTFPQDMAAYWDTDSADIFARFAGVDMLNIPIANGGTVIFAPADHRYADQDLQIGKDFADAISLGFTRYFDFQRLEEQNRALEVANVEVREATRLKSQFLATMSHELRTPMNAIIGFTRLVLRRGKNLEDRQRENLEKVKLSADHLLSLINDILDLSKVEAGRVDILASSFDVAPVIENCCATVGPTMGKPRVALVPDIQADMGQVHTDEARLRQVIINLLSNALKFTESGEVRVTARLVKSDLEIVVSDTGIGIPEDQLETIFEEFRQVDNSSTRRHQGTGLGLAITKKLIELLGGTISVQSEEGKGSTFTLYIPSTYGEALQFREVPVISSRARLIVSIDDDPNVAVLLRQELEEDGYQVISALNADEGIALVKQHKPLAVTTDILMPGKDGWQTIAALKEDAETRDIPIIVVSAIENRSLGFSMGVHDYLVKPFDHEGIISALNRIETE